MAREEALKCISLQASDDLSALQWTFVDVNSSELLIAPTGQGAKVIGVLQDKPAAAGRVGSVAIEGVTMIKLGADSLTAGMAVTTGADGQAEQAATGDIAHGTLLEGGDTDEVVACLLSPNGYIVPA